MLTLLYSLRLQGEGVGAVAPLAPLNLPLVYVLSDHLWICHQLAISRTDNDHC